MRVVRRDRVHHSSVEDSGEEPLMGYGEMIDDSIECVAKSESKLAEPDCDIERDTRFHQTFVEGS